MAEYMIQGETLTAIADAIREKSGNSAALSPSDMAGVIAEIQAGGGSVRMETGSVILAEDIDITHPNYYEISHNLGVLPKAVIFLPYNGEGPHTNQAFQAMAFVKNPDVNNNYITYSSIYYTKPDIKRIYLGLSCYPTENVFYVGMFESTLKAILKGDGVKYYWWAFAWEENE